MVTALGEPAELWENVTRRQYVAHREADRREKQSGWNRDSRVGNQYNHLTSGVGYASEPALKHLGEVGVRWPAGKAQTLITVSMNQVLLVRE